MGVMCTRNIRFLKKGDKGDKGDRGRLPVPYGEYVAGTAYTATDLIAPYVLCNGQYYVMNKTTTWQQANKTPAQDYAQYGSNATWILLERYKAIFVELLMANLGLIGKSVFYQEYMFSQYGKIGSTEVSTEGHYAVPIDAGGTFEPNFIINFLTGEMRCNRGEFAGGIRVPFVAFDDADLNYMYSEVVNYGSSHNTTEKHYQLKTTSARYIDLTGKVTQYADGVHVHIPANAALDGCRFSFIAPYYPFGYDWGGGLHIQVTSGGYVCSDAINIENKAYIITSLSTARRPGNGGLIEVVIRVKNGESYAFITSGDIPNLPWYSMANNI